jgi:hypothetical protein
MQPLPQLPPLLLLLHYSRLPLLPLTLSTSTPALHTGQFLLKFCI